MEENLFQYEEEILATAKEICNNNDYSSNPLIGQYRVLCKRYEKQLLQSKKIIKISDSQQKMLNETNEKLRKLTDELNEAKNILQNQNNELLEKNEEIEAQRDKIEQTNVSLLNAFNLIEQKNKKITDSIRYAQKIQQSILPSTELIQHIFPESFVLYKPKDIVSGDFYWFHKKNNYLFFTAADCTGHGVPGAFMSLMGNNMIRQAVEIHDLTKPAEILNHINNDIISNLRNNPIESVVKDGMDIAFCTLDKENMVLQFAGAQNPLYIIRQNELIEFKGERHLIGDAFNERFPAYTNHEIPVSKGDCFYIFSDGYADQFGGELNKKFMTKNFRETILKIHHLPMPEQKLKLDQIFENWKGANHEQIDDVLVVGIRI